MNDLAYRLAFAEFTYLDRYARKPAAGQKSIAWNEDDHPRDPDGKFGDGTGGGGTAVAEPPAKPKAKEKPAEPARPAATSKPPHHSAPLAEQRKWAAANGAVIPKSTAKEILPHIVQHALEAGRKYAGDDPWLQKEIPTPEEVERNWMKVFRARKMYRGEKPAFTDLDQRTAELVQHAINQNHGNELYNRYVEKNGAIPVFYARGEKIAGAKAEYRSGAIWFYDGDWTNKYERGYEPERGWQPSPPSPGMDSASTNGGFTSTFRHEYGHHLYAQLTREQKAEWRGMLKDGKTTRKEFTDYAKTNDDEAFAEAFAVGTDPDYQPGVFPEWVDQLIDKQREWFL
jgi:hypothetical protein